MSFILDIAFIAILVLFVFLGIHKGFIRSLLDFGAYAAAFIGSIFLSGAIASPLYNKILAPSVYNGIYSAIERGVSTDGLQASVTNVLGSVPEFIKNYANGAGISFDDLIKQTLNADLSAQTTTVARSIADNIVAPIAIAACRAFLLIILFIVLLISLRILSYLISKVLTIAKPAEKVDNTLGGVFGALKGVLFIAFCVTALIFIASVTAKSFPEFHNTVYQSYLVRLVDRIIMNL